MRDYKIGFIGCGKMAKATIKGLIESNKVNSKNIIASKSSENNIDVLSKELGIKIVLDNKFLVQNSDIVIIAVKPAQISTIIDDIKNEIDSNKLIISVLAGVTTNFIETQLKQNVKLIRVMPNTPVSVKEGMIAICGGANATDSDIEIAQLLFSSIGKTLIVEESQMDIVTAISGSGPAFFYKVINDIARAGEKLGLDYDKALALSIQTALGSAKMAEKRNISMEELISNVATKGGCTRVGVDVMEETGLSDIFYDVIKNTTQKAKELGN